MRPMRLLAACLALVAGCSWATSRPLRHHPNGFVECSASSAAPALDTTVAVLAMFIGVLGMVGSNQGRPDDDDEKAVGLVSLGAAGLFAASAVSGKRQTSECRVARAAMGPRWIAPSGTPDPEPAPPAEQPRVHVDVDVNVTIE